MATGSELPTVYDEVAKCNKCGFCQAVCPIFDITKDEQSVARGHNAHIRKLIEGDLNDAESGISKAHADSRGYALLDFLNARPRNVYLAGLKNPANDADHGHSHEADDSHGHHAG